MTDTVSEPGGKVPDAVWQPEEIGYCTNVHPGESLKEICRNLRLYAAKVRVLRKLQTMEVGLWLSQQAVNELQEPGRIDELKEALKSNGLQVRSLNGFPYGGFHLENQQPVKTRVYEPDWRDPKRLTYSKQLVDVLSQIMPDGAETASISTLPLGYKTRQNWRRNQWPDSFGAFEQLTEHCYRVHQETGKRIVFAIEMEPDCALEVTDDLLLFFKQIRPELKHHQYLTACLDACHQAVNFENLLSVVRELRNAMIEISKVQLSSALLLNLHDVSSAEQFLSGFAKELCQSPWLHQTRIRTSYKPIQMIEDFKMLLEPTVFEPLYNEKQAPKPHAYLTVDAPPEVRIHCHVPLYLEQVAFSRSLPARTTQQYLSELMVNLCLCYYQQPRKPVVEVETYSWSLILEQLEQNLLEGIVRELEWAEQQFEQFRQRYRVQQ